jgi:hypothetical protein
MAHCFNKICRFLPTEKNALQIAGRGPLQEAKENMLQKVIIINNLLNKNKNFVIFRILDNNYLSS